MQRTWIYKDDPSVQIAKDGIKSQVLPYDIATSLPMGDGVYAIQKKSSEPNAFRRIRQDVTLIANNAITKK